MFYWFGSYNEQFQIDGSEALGFRVVGDIMHLEGC